MLRKCRAVPTPKLPTRYRENLRSRLNPGRTVLKKCSGVPHLTQHANVTALRHRGCSIYCSEIFRTLFPEPYVIECRHCSRKMFSLLDMRATMHCYNLLLICIKHHTMIYDLFISKCTFQTFLLVDFCPILTFT